MRTIQGVGRPIFNGANGYLSRDKYGHYTYTVTKGPLEAALGVMVNGRASTAGGGSWAPKYNEEGVFNEKKGTRSQTSRKNQSTIAAGYYR